MRLPILFQKQQPAFRPRVLMEGRIQARYQVRETLTAVRDKTLVEIPRSSVIEVTDGSRLPSFVEVIWNAEVYSVLRIDLESKATPMLNDGPPETGKRSRAAKAH